MVYLSYEEVAEYMEKCGVSTLDEGWAYMIAEDDYLDEQGLISIFCHSVYAILKYKRA